MSSLTYRPGIDGLRAVAVIAVIVYHLNAAWLPGGFTGVDVFFVISGYLITSILVLDADRSELSLTRFYQRRIARILPALLAMAVVTILAARCIYSSQDLALAAGYLAASLLSLTNLKLMFQGSYFELLPDAHPYLHCWSLSLEEQFYLVFPLVILIFRGGWRRFLGPVLLAMMLLSLCLCLWLTSQRPVWAFYFPGARAWELLAGCLLAVWRIDGVLLKCDGRCLAGWPPLLGVGLIALGFGLVGSSGFPGWQALLPVVGSLLLIGACDLAPGHPVMRVLGSRLMVRVGKLSYSLYLWHWPVFSLVDYRLLEEAEWFRSMLKVLLTLVCAITSYGLVEKPVRHRLSMPRFRLAAYALLGVGLVLCVPWGLTMQRSHYVNSRNGASPPLVLNSRGRNGTWMLMGDSHGSMYGKTLLDFARERDLRLVVTSSAAQDALPRIDGKPALLWEESLDAVESFKPDVIILACAWSAHLDKAGRRLEVAVDSLSLRTGCLLLLTQPPILPPNATRKGFRQGCRPPFNEDPELRAWRLSCNSRVMQTAASKVMVIDMDELIMGGEKGIPFFDSKGRMLYHDLTHLSASGADRIRPSLLGLLRQAPGGAGSLGRPGQPQAMD